MENNKCYQKAKQKIKDEQPEFPIYYSCSGPQGKQGPQGEQGPQGPQGPVGPEGTCEYKGSVHHELLLNGNMEEATENSLPKDWDCNNCCYSSLTIEDGNVHTGNSSFRFKSGAIIKQTISTPCDKCCYRLSFFAKGCNTGDNLEATISFKMFSGEAIDKKLIIRKEDLTNNFSYYTIISNPTPLGVTEIIVQFTTNSNEYIYLDDVSLTIV